MCTWHSAEDSSRSPRKFPGLSAKLPLLWYPAPQVLFPAVSPNSGFSPQFSNTLYCAWTLPSRTTIQKACPAESREGSWNTLCFPCPGWLCQLFLYQLCQHVWKQNSVHILLFDDILFLAYVFRSFFCLFKLWKHSFYIVSDNFQYPKSCMSNLTFVFIQMFERTFIWLMFLNFGLWATVQLSSLWGNTMRSRLRVNIFREALCLLLLGILGCCSLGFPDLIGSIYSKSSMWRLIWTAVELASPCLSILGCSCAQKGRSGWIPRTPNKYQTS